VTCDICGKILIKIYYVDREGNLCEECLIKIHNGFPKGRGAYKAYGPCNGSYGGWYYEETFGDTREDRGYHDKGESLELDLFFN
ncbi:Hypothetical protein HVR_LOCUS637, partial [uncultured virus]